MVKIVHCFESFVPGGAQVRTINLMNEFGGWCEHVILPLRPRTDALSRVAEGVKVTVAEPPADLRTWTVLRHAQQVCARVKPSLFITYNWGTMEATLGMALRGQCPVVHIEDGFGADERTQLKWRRVVARRLVLSLVSAVVVPSRTLEEIARRQFRVAERKLHYIPNGIQVDRLVALAAERRARGGRFRMGFVGHLRPEKNVELLLRAVAGLRGLDWELVVVGDGVCRAELEALARELGVGERVEWLGNLADPAPLYSTLDLFVNPSHTEQMPMALLEAMASALPVVCTDVGDCRQMLGGTAEESLVRAGDLAGLTAALERAAGSPDWRARTGRANQERCVVEFTQRAMGERYRALFEGLIQK